MTEDIPWPFDLLHNPKARADWERRHPEKAAEMRERFPLREPRGATTMTRWEAVACCDSCWELKEPDREPVRLRDRELQTCHYCKLETDSGIYIRERLDD